MVWNLSQETRSVLSSFLSKRLKMFWQVSNLFLSAAIGQRPRNFLSCSSCCCSCRNRTGVLQLPSRALYPLSYSHIVIQVVKNYLFNLRMSKTMPKTLDQCWSTLVFDSWKKQSRVVQLQVQGAPGLQMRCSFLLVNFLPSEFTLQKKYYFMLQ